MNADIKITHQMMKFVRERAKEAKYLARYYECQGYDYDIEFVKCGPNNCLEYPILHKLGKINKTEDNEEI